MINPFKQEEKKPFTYSLIEHVKRARDEKIIQGLYLVDNGTTYNNRHCSSFLVSFLGDTKTLKEVAMID